MEEILDLKEVMVMTLDDNWHRTISGGNDEKLEWVSIGEVSPHPPRQRKSEGVLTFRGCPAKFSIKANKTGGFTIYKVMTKDTFDEVKDLTIGEYLDTVTEFIEGEEDTDV